MKLNLGPEMARETACIIAKFVEAGWTQEDLGFAWRKLGDVEMNVVVAPKLLWYQADEDIPQAVVWYGLRFSWKCPIEDIQQMEAGVMMEWLKSAGLMPFKDEDVRGVLTRFKERFDLDDEDSEYHTYECWVNPNYPEGKWENHTL